MHGVVSGPSSSGRGTCPRRWPSSARPCGWPRGTPRRTTTSAARCWPAASEALPIDDRSRLHFALADTLDHAGAYADAFDHARRGNDLRREIDRRGGIVYDPAAHSRFIDRLITVFDAAHFEHTRG